VSSATPSTHHRSWMRIVGISLVFISLLGLVVAVTAVLRPLPAPGAGGTCGPGKGSESAIAAFFNPGSIGAGAEPASPAAAILQWMAFVGQCQASTDARMLQALGILVLALILGVVGLVMWRAGRRTTARAAAFGPDGAPTAGWYPDPAPAATGTRWWDGQHWGPARPATVSATEIASTAPTSTLVIEAGPAAGSVPAAESPWGPADGTAASLAGGPSTQPVPAWPAVDAAPGVPTDAPAPDPTVAGPVGPFGTQPDQPVPPPAAWPGAQGGPGVPTDAPAPDPTGSGPAAPPAGEAEPADGEPAAPEPPPTDDPGPLPATPWVDI